MGSSYFFKKLKQIHIAKLTPVESCVLLAEQLLPDGTYLYFYKLNRFYQSPPDLIISHQRLDSICVRGSEIALGEISAADVREYIDQFGNRVHLNPLYVKLLGAKNRVETFLAKMYVDNNVRTMYTMSPDDVGIKLLSAPPSSPLHRDSDLIAAMKDYAEKWKKTKSKTLDAFFNKFYFYPYTDDPSVITKSFPDTAIEDWVKPILGQNNVDPFLLDLAMSRIIQLEYSKENSKRLKYLPWVMVLSPSNFGKSKLFELATGRECTSLVNKVSTWVGYEIKDKSKCHRGTIDTQGGTVIVDEFDQCGFKLDELKPFSRDGNMLVGVNMQHKLNTTTTFVFLANITIHSGSHYHRTIYAEFEHLLVHKVQDYQSIFARTYLYIPNSADGVKGMLQYEEQIRAALRTVRAPLSKVLEIILHDNEITRMLETHPVDETCLSYYKKARDIGGTNIYAELSSAKINAPRVDNSIALTRSLLCFSLEELETIITEKKLSNELRERLLDRFAIWAHYFCNGSKATISLLMDSRKKDLPNQIDTELKLLMSKSVSSKLYLVTLMVSLEATYQVTLKQLINQKEPKEPKEPNVQWGWDFGSNEVYLSDLLIYVCKRVCKSFNEDKSGGQSASTFIKRGHQKSARCIIDYLGIEQNGSKNEPNEKVALSLALNGSSNKSNIFAGNLNLKIPDSTRAKVNRFLDLYPEYKHHLQPAVEHLTSLLNLNQNEKESLNV